MSGTEIKIGDRVVIVKSPYGSVKNGTEAKVVRIDYQGMSQQWVNYILSLPNHNIFKRHEIEKIQE